MSESARNWHRTERRKDWLALLGVAVVSALVFGLLPWPAVAG